MKIKIIILATAILALLFILSGWTFYTRMVLDYNSKGNYFDEKTLVTYNEQGVITFGLMTFVLLIVTLLMIKKIKKLRKNLQA